MANTTFSVPNQSTRDPAAFMLFVHIPSRGTSYSGRPRAFHPSLDGLEDRILLYSTTGGGRATAL